MEGYVRSDLAAECGADREGDGVHIRKSESGGCRILHVQIKTAQAAERVGKPMGHYVTVECGNVGHLSGGELDRARCALSVEIREMAEHMCGKRIGARFSVLIVGLGNREIAADAVGPETVRLLSVTRHLRQADPLLLSTTGLCEIAAIAPGVLGQTGMEAVEQVRGAAETVRPDLVVAVDALAARSVDRLGGTVQISDTGIHPGSGIGNRRRAINTETVGVPVMALGVPTVVDTATLVCDTLRQSGAPSPLPPECRGVIERGRALFVSPKEVDLLTAAAASLLSTALEKAFAVRDGDFCKNP